MKSLNTIRMVLLMPVVVASMCGCSNKTARGYTVKYRFERTVPVQSVISGKTTTLQGKNKWFLIVEVATKEEVAGLGVYLATQNGDKIESAACPCKGQKVIGDSNSYVSSPLEIEDMGDNKFQVSEVNQGFAALTGKSSNVVKLESRKLVLAVEMVKERFGTPRVVSKTTIAVPPGDN